VDVQKALDSLLQELSAFHRSLGFHGVDPELIIQVFRQVSCFCFVIFTLTNNFLPTKLATVICLLNLCENKTSSCEENCMVLLFYCISLYIISLFECLSQSHPRCHG
jgi:hypothetical protein